MRLTQVAVVVFRYSPRRLGESQSRSASSFCRWWLSFFDQRSKWFFVDFSRSLDSSQPANAAWTGESITAINGTEPTLANQRSGLNGTNLDAFTIDTVTKNEVAYGTVAIAAGAASIGNNINLNFSGNAADYVDGQTFLPLI